jgi:hypothetical protein
MKVANRSSENVAQLKYLEMTVANQNLIQDEIKRKLASGNDLASPRNVKIRIYKTKILAVLYGCETWSLPLREEYRLRVFENIWTEESLTGGWRKLHNEELHILYSHTYPN